MWDKVTSIAGRLSWCGFLHRRNGQTPPSLMRVALADDPVAAPKDVPIDVGRAKTDGTRLLPAVPTGGHGCCGAPGGMDPGSLMQNPDGSFVYRRTTRWVGPRAGPPSRVTAA